MVKPTKESFVIIGLVSLTKESFVAGEGLVGPKKEMFCCRGSTD
jgi:hypothetical protein